MKHNKTASERSNEMLKEANILEDALYKLRDIEDKILPKSPFINTFGPKARQFGQNLLPHILASAAAYGTYKGMGPEKEDEKESLTDMLKRIATAAAVYGGTTLGTNRLAIKTLYNMPITPSSYTLADDLKTPFTGPFYKLNQTLKKLL